MSEVFGFDEVIQDMLKFERNASKAKTEMQEVADEMRDQAKQNAQAGGLYRTGQGIGGIVSQHSDNESVVGWSARPGLHLYFHEIGFHALDNRRKKWKLKRGGKRGKGARSYKGVRATYVPPTPHMRPAFDSKQSEFYRRVQNKLTE